MTYLKLVRPGHTKKAPEFNWAAAALFAVVAVIIAATVYMLTRDTEFDHRVSADKLHEDPMITTALRAARGAIPDDVSALHCYFRPWGGGGEPGMAHVQCDVTLRGRAVQDMGTAKTVWLDDVYQNPNEPNHPLHGVSRETDTMLATDFNFAIDRATDGGLTVLSNVDESKLSFDQASGVVIATALVFREAMTKELAVAARKSPDSVKGTWKH
ncbi:hypothetical protein HQ619_07675 [Burkholderia gladioli]|uniref:hypothetical protein n=1 Tax=Burkholderia gladioli TaxID=28095 RepID=UPI00155FA537|nr:hypothetical protein [Burkholderia gladioli]NRF83805.1 hypothetical protein [Burkholderia gladioli]